MGDVLRGLDVDSVYAIAYSLVEADLRARGVTKIALEWRAGQTVQDCTTLQAATIPGEGPRYADGHTLWVAAQQMPRKEGFDVSR